MHFVIPLTVLLYREPATRAICYYYYPPCGNNTHFAPPNALCQDVCNYLTIDLCPEEWALALNFISGIQELLELIQLEFVNCSQPGAPLGSLPHCCSDAGIDIMPGEILPQDCMDSISLLTESSINQPPCFGVFLFFFGGGGGGGDIKHGRIGSGEAG